MVQNTSTHPSLIRVHVGVNQRCRADDVEPAAVPLQKASTRNVPAGRWSLEGFEIWPNNDGALRGEGAQSVQWGAGAELDEGSKCKRTEATFSYTLVLVSVAVP